MPLFYSLDDPACKLGPVDLFDDKFGSLPSALRFGGETVGVMPGDFAINKDDHMDFKSDPGKTGGFKRTILAVFCEDCGIPAGGLVEDALSVQSVLNLRAKPSGVRPCLKT